MAKGKGKYIRLYTSNKQLEAGAAQAALAVSKTKYATSGREAQSIAHEEAKRAKQEARQAEKERARDWTYNRKAAEELRGDTKDDEYPKWWDLKLSQVLALLTRRPLKADDYEDFLEHARKFIADHYETNKSEHPSNMHSWHWEAMVGILYGVWDNAPYSVRHPEGGIVLGKVKATVKVRQYSQLIDLYKGERI